MEKEKKTWKFFSWGTLWAVLASCILNTIIWIGFHGVPLMGIPQKEDVKSVTILCNNAEERNITESEEMDLLLKACNLLNFQLWGEKEGEAELAVIYHLKNGSDVRVEANGTTVWWRGKTHAIKERDTFVNIVQGLFFDRGKP